MDSKSALERLMTLLLTTAISLLTVSTANTEAVSLRLRMGAPIPVAGFHQKEIRLDQPGFTLAFASKGEFSYGVDFVMQVSKLPLSLVASIGYVRLDDLGWESEETTYEYPLGTGRFTDFKHRFIPYTLSLEYSLRLTSHFQTALGLGLGAYRYSLINEGTDSGYLGDIDCVTHSCRPFSNQTLYGWKLHFLQEFSLFRSLSFLAQFDYNRLSISSSGKIGMAPAGFHNHIDFFRIEGGVAISR